MSSSPGYKNIKHGSGSNLRAKRRTRGKLPILLVLRFKDADWRQLTAALAGTFDRVARQIYCANMCTQYLLVQCVLHSRRGR
jgi:hypothetical protein